MFLAKSSMLFEAKAFAKARSAGDDFCEVSIFFNMAEEIPPGWFCAISTGAEARQKTKVIVFLFIVVQSYTLSTIFYTFVCDLSINIY